MDDEQEQEADNFHKAECFQELLLFEANNEKFVYDKSKNGMLEFSGILFDNSQLSHH